MSRGSAEKIVPDVWQRGRSGAGFSKLAMARSAPSMSVADRARRCRSASCTGRSQPNAEQSLQRPVISAVPPSNGKSAPLPLIERLVRRRGRAGCRRRRTGSRSRPGRTRRRPVRRGQPAPSAASRRGRGPASTPNRRVSPQARARTAGVTSSARRNASRLRCLARSSVSVAASVARMSRVASAGRVEAERGEDRVGVGLDELERLVALARPGQDGRDLRRGPCAVPGRPELGDRHDRGRRPGRGVAGASRGWTARRSTAAGARRRRAGPEVGLATAPRRSARRRRRSAAARRAGQPELSAGQRHEGGQDEEAADDGERGALHAAILPEGPDSRRRGLHLPGKKNAPSGRADGA